MVGKCLNTNYQICIRFHVYRPRPNLSVSTLSFSSWLFFIFFLADLKGNRFSEVSFVIFTLWLISASSILKKMYNLKKPREIKVKWELDFFFFLVSTDEWSLKYNFLDTDIYKYDHNPIIYRNLGSINECTRVSLQSTCMPC